MKKEWEEGGSVEKGDRIEGGVGRKRGLKKERKEGGRDEEGVRRRREG